mmetsp:Transcript_1502/g.3844  ORF Transcript_1502/g.3844 Transcript_1502/m.3844 type:complete len:382 (-) Transcript_1502:346-1491(-)
MSNMRLRQLVVAQIGTLKIVLPEILHDPLEVVLHVRQWLERHEDIGLLIRIVSVCQLCDVARPDFGIHGAEGSGGFGNCDFEGTFGVVGAFGHHAKAIEVHVGARGYGDEGGVGDLVLFDELFQAGDGECPRRLEDDASIIVSQLDGIANLVSVHGDHPVHVLLTQSKRFSPNGLHGRPIGEQSHGGQRDDPSRGEGGGHARGVGSLDAVDLDCGTYLFDVGGDTGEHPTSAAADKDGIDRLANALFQYFECNRTLSGDHKRVVERMYHRQPLLELQPLSLHGRLVVIVPDKSYFHRLAAVLPHRIYLDARRGEGHANDRAAAEHPCGERHALGVVSGRAGHHASLQGGLGEGCHFVVRPANFEGEYRLGVLSFEEDGVVE